MKKLVFASAMALASVSLVSTPALRAQDNSGQITISDATNAADDGTYGLADFSGIFLYTGTLPLDFSKQLIGQPTGGDPFGTPTGNGGDFNFFSNGSTRAPTGFNYFTIQTDNAADGDTLVMTSFAPEVTPPSGGSSAPLPSGLALGLLCLGTLAVAVRRCKLRAF